MKNQRDVKHMGGGVYSRWAAVLLTAVSFGCAVKEGHTRLDVQSVATQHTVYHGPKHSLVIGKFVNKSTYMQGIFSDGKDRLGFQARQILKTHLSQTNRFILVDRDNMDEIAAESRISGKQQQLTGGQVVLTGAVTEFGRREIGSYALLGIIGRSKKQVAYAKVSISIVDTGTSQIVFSAQGASEYDLTNEHVLGFGSSVGYDATLNDKVLNLAIIEAVDRLVEGLERGQWQPVQSQEDASFRALPQPRRSSKPQGI